ncbi:MAG: glycosyltransferase family 4 protein [Candidatus Pacebacteria bacterium]|nr:glycosyltransferase family 4 protein [Candidatus Paceibacterota bacterium]
MKLVIATPLYPPEIGGPATYSQLLSEELPSRNITVELVKFGEVRQLPKVLRHLAYFWKVFKVARRSDVVFALDPVSTGLPALLAARCARKPFIVKIVGDYAWEQGQQRFGITKTLDDFILTKQVPFIVHLLRKIQSFVARNAARIIVPSEYLKGIVSSWDMPHRDIDVIYNAVHYENAGTVPKSVARLPRPLVVSAGRLVPWKGMEGVIEAVALLRERGMEASLAIVGDGPDRIALVARAENKLGADYVFTGELSHADTLATVGSADVFVLNSTYEGLSHLLIEAVMLGTPIVATRVGGNPEVVTHKKQGLLVESSNTPELSEALYHMLTDAKLRSHVNARARESAKRFSVETMLDAVVSVIRNV